MPKDKTNSGWIKIHRKIVDSDIFTDDLAFKVFMWILCTVDVKSGTKKSGRFWASEILGIKPTTYYQVLKRLEKKYQLISLKSDNKMTTILVNKWNEYQKTNDNKMTTNRQQNDTTQEYKNIRNNINDFSSGFEKDCIEAVEVFNKYRGTKHRSIKSIYSNFCKYRETYSNEEIIQAIKNIPKFNWWNQHADLEIVFRTKNKNGECDNIGKLLNSKPDRSPSDYQLDLIRIEDDNRTDN